MSGFPAEPGAISLLLSLSAGVVLAAVAGFRAFVPLFAVGLAGRLDWLPLSTTFAWLGSTPALVAFGSASVFELLGDKVPAVDHALDVIGTLVRPVAGTVAVAAMLGRLDPLWSTVVGLAVGGTVAGSVHLLKAKTRLGSSLTTAGLANPWLSAAEDGVALGGTALALLWPLLALGLLLLAAVAVWWTWRWLSARLAGGPRHAPAPAGPTPGQPAGSRPRPAAPPSPAR